MIRKIEYYQLKKKKKKRGQMGTALQLYLGAV